MERVYNRPIKPILGLILVLALAACAGRPQTAALNEAKQTYAAAQNQPEVAANAPVLLHEASQALTQAEQANNEAEQQHLAYLAQKKAQMAITVGEREAARKSVSQLEEQRQKLLLQAREQEAERARQQAQAREQQLAQTREQVQSQEEQLALTRQEAEARKEELQQAQNTAQQREKELENLQRKLADLQQERAQMEQMGVSPVLTLGDVLFAFGKAQLMPGAIPVVERLANFLEEHPDRSVEIIGHTDSVGNAQYNQQLSENRAKAVGTALAQAGVDADRITTKGVGEKFPIASNDVPGGRQQNRRVEIVIRNKDAQTPAAGG